MYDRLGEVKKQHEFGNLHRRDIDWLIEQAEKLKIKEIDIKSNRQLIYATEKYSLYFDQENEELIIYNGFSYFAFGLNDLGDDVYRGAYQPKLEEVRKV
ncbi:hypothetical protein D3C73_278740 [compost metagenome]